MSGAIALPASRERIAAAPSPFPPSAGELTENRFVLRNRAEHTDDGLHGVDGVFPINSF